MNEIRVFNNPDFGDVRTVMIEGEPWFCGKDVAGLLGYSNEKDAIKRHCEEDEVVKHALGVQTGVKKDGSPAVMIADMHFINESGLYSLIFGSKLDSAKKFKRWVTSEVLPSLRKTGSYGAPKTIPEQIQLLAQGNVELNKRVDNLIDRMDKFELDLPLLPIEADRITEAVRRKGVSSMGGKQSVAYQNRGLRQKVYVDIYHELKRQFSVRTYKAIQRKNVQKAIGIINGYNLPIVLSEAIDNINLQHR